MKHILSMLFVLLAANSFSQQKLDREIIEESISDIVSEFYYPRLMARYEKSDTTLTQQDYFYLYYGYVFQPDYKPLLKTNYLDSLNSVFGNRRVTMGDEFSKIERYSKAILSVEPFNPRDINVLAYAYQQIGYKDKAAQQRYKLDMIIKTIKSTGTGLSPNHPWHVIYPDHEIDLLNMMDAEPGRSIVISSSVVFVSCKTPPDRQAKGYYFDYSEIYKRDPEYLKDVKKPKRKLEINPIPNN